MQFEVQSEQQVDHLLQADLFVAGVSACFEINGQNHFYPYTKKYHQMSVYKQKLLRQNRLCFCPESPTDAVPINKAYSYVNLNVHLLGGLQADRPAFRRYLSRLLEQMLVEQQLIAREDAHYF